MEREIISEAHTTAVLDSTPREHGRKA